MTSKLVLAAEGERLRRQDLPAASVAGGGDGVLDDDDASGVTHLPKGVPGPLESFPTELYVRAVVCDAGEDRAIYDFRSGNCLFTPSLARKSCRPDSNEASQELNDARCSRGTT